LTSTGCVTGSRRTSGNSDASLMIRSLTAILLSAALTASHVAAQAALPAVAPKVACAAMRGFDPKLPEAPTQISEAREAEVDGKTMCVVKGYVSPQIKFEVRLPVQGWTQRYLQTGCGGLCGNLSIRAPQRGCPMLQRGEFVTASTDMGHEGQGGTWGASDPQLRVDFAYRGVHTTALVAKALIARFYGQPPRWSYFSGCSDGGREGMMEAQRYPDDFDGIAAGAPAFNFLVQNSFYHAWNARSVAPEGMAVLLPADLPVLHAGALAACDTLDGLKDGIIQNPPACRFDPATVECRTTSQTGCLSHAAVVAAAAIYSGARGPAGEKLVIGGPQHGSELSWAGVFVPQSADAPVFSAMIASDMLRSLGYWRPLAPDWTLSQFQFTPASLEGLMPMHGLYDATDPDLSAFARRRGKLVMWHGWSDPHISPLNSVAYVQAVTDRMGAAASRGVLRLFLLPGMYHCNGGEGPTSVDVLTPLTQWVEQSRAPDALVASFADSTAAAGRGRAIFAFPATSLLQAGMDSGLPASWRAGPPMTVPSKLYASWAGARLFEPGYQRVCGFDGSTFACRAKR
jgi:Tannase and feruloyl esterase